jgi:hypothetical protein
LTVFNLLDVCVYVDNGVLNKLEAL